MKQDKKNLYEGMYIISAKLSEAARQKALERILTGITERGGEILKSHDLGRKRLAYEIKEHREGQYHLIYFNINPAAIAELWRDYHLNEDLVRFLTMRAEKVMDEIKFKPLVEIEE